MCVTLVVTHPINTCIENNVCLLFIAEKVKEKNHTFLGYAVRCKNCALCDKSTKFGRKDRF